MPGRSPDPGDGRSPGAHAGTPASIDATTARTAARTSSSGSAQARTSVSLRPPASAPASMRPVPVRVDDGVEDPSFRRSHGAGLEQQHRAERTQRPRRARRSRRHVRGGLGEIDGVGESAFVQMGAYVRHEGAEVAGAILASAQCFEHRSGAATQFGDALAQCHQPARMPDEIGQPTSSARGPSCEWPRGRAERGTRRCPRAASTGTPSWRISLSTVVQLTFDDSAPSVGTERGPEGSACEQRRVGRRRHHGHRGERVGSFGAVHRGAQRGDDRVERRRPWPLR